MSSYPNIDHVNYGCGGGYLKETLEFASERDIFDEVSYPYVGY